MPGKYTVRQIWDEMLTIACETALLLMLLALTGKIDSPQVGNTLCARHWTHCEDWTQNRCRFRFLFLSHTLDLMYTRMKQTLLLLTSTYLTVYVFRQHGQLNRTAIVCRSFVILVTILFFEVYLPSGHKDPVNRFYRYAIIQINDVSLMLQC